MKCLQAVLNIAEYNAGPEDGQIGPRTRNALAAFRKDVPLDITKPLSAKNAVVFCRLAGDSRAGLKDAWPSRRLPYRITYSDAVVDRARKDLETGLDRLPQVFGSVLPFELPLTAIVHVVASSEEFEAASRQEFGYSERRAKARRRAMRNAGDPVGHSVLSRGHRLSEPGTTRDATCSDEVRCLGQYRARTLA